MVPDKNDEMVIHKVVMQSSFSTPIAVEKSLQWNINLKSLLQACRKM